MADERDELDDLIDAILASRRGFKEDIIRSRPMDLVDMLSSGLQELGVEPRQAARSANRFRDIFSMAPLTGDMEDMRDILQGGLQGDVRRAGLGALGFVPLIGGMVKKGGGKVIDFAAELTKRKGRRVPGVPAGQLPKRGQIHPNVRKLIEDQRKEVDKRFDDILDRPEYKKIKEELDKLDIPLPLSGEVIDFLTELLKRGRKPKP